jgi:hypothetical protein
VGRNASAAVAFCAAAVGFPDLLLEIGRSFSLAPSLLQRPPVRWFVREDHEMAPNAHAPNSIQVEQVKRFRSELQTSDVEGLGQYSFLSEVVELIFGMMTLCWIVTSLCALT